MTAARASRVSALESLAWDSDHFGFPVARLTVPDMDFLALREALDEARTGGFRLIHWSAAPGRVAPEPILREFAGLLADRKATFAVDPIPAPPGYEPAGPVRVVEWPRQSPSEPLLRLGVAAGLHSRYRVDPRMPAGAFESLYRTWTARSANGELADAVLVAAAPGEEADPLGMVTVALDGQTGQIGLIAVRDDARGRGVGSMLIRAAHRWMLGHRARRATVVTQLDNGAACRLYERSGYRLADLRNFYHFWPREPAGTGPRAPARLAANEPESRPTMLCIELSVVIPVYRSAAVLPTLVQRLMPVLETTGLRHEVVLVEDGSPDESWQVLTELQADYPDRLVAIQLMRNFGQHNALMCGLRHAQGSLVITMDDDLQNPPEEIPKLLAAIRAGGFDLVYGIYGDKKHSGWRNAGSTLVNAFYRLTFRTDVTITSFRILRRELLECIFSYNLNFTFIDGLLAWNTQRIGEVPVEHHPRAASRSGYNLFKLTSLAFNLFTNFSLMPLQLISFLGLASAVSGLLGAMFYLALFLSHRILVPGYASTIMTILVLGGIQLMALGVMGEYLGRLHINVNRKPQYVARQVRGSERVPKSPGGGTRPHPAENSVTMTADDGLRQY